MSNMAQIIVYEYPEGCGYNVATVANGTPLVWHSRYPFNAAETIRRVSVFLSKHPAADVSRVPAKIMDIVRNG